jgi:hypothetical protein
VGRSSIGSGDEGMREELNRQWGGGIRDLFPRPRWGLAREDKEGRGARQTGTLIGQRRQRGVRDSTDGELVPRWRCGSFWKQSADAAAEAWKQWRFAHPRPAGDSLRNLALLP